MMENEDVWRDLLRTLGTHQQAFNDQLERLNAYNVVPNSTLPLLAPIKKYSALVHCRMCSLHSLTFHCSALEGLTAAVIKESGLIRDNVIPESDWEKVKGFSLKFIKAGSENDPVPAYVSQ